MLFFGQMHKRRTCCTREISSATSKKNVNVFLPRRSNPLLRIDPGKILTIRKEGERVFLDRFRGFQFLVQIGIFPNFSTFQNLEASGPNLSGVTYFQFPIFVPNLECWVRPAQTAVLCFPSSKFGTKIGNFETLQTALTPRGRTYSRSRSLPFFCVCFREASALSRRQSGELTSILTEMTLPFRWHQGAVQLAMWKGWGYALFGENWAAAFQKARDGGSMFVCVWVSEPTPYPVQ